MRRNCATAVFGTVPKKHDSREWMLVDPDPARSGPTRTSRLTLTISSEPLFNEFSALRKLTAKWVLPKFLESGSKSHTSLESDRRLPSHITLNTLSYVLFILIFCPKPSFKFENILRDCLPTMLNKLGFSFKISEYFWVFLLISISESLWDSVKIHWISINIAPLNFSVVLYWLKFSEFSLNLTCKRLSLIKI